MVGYATTISAGIVGAGLWGWKLGPPSDSVDLPHEEPINETQLDDRACADDLSGAASSDELHGDESLEANMSARPVRWKHAAILAAEAAAKADPFSVAGRRPERLEGAAERDSGVRAAVADVAVDRDRTPTAAEGDAPEPEPRAAQPEPWRGGGSGTASLLGADRGPPAASSEGSEAQPPPAKHLYERERPQSSLGLFLRLAGLEASLYAACAGFWCRRRRRRLAEVSPATAQERAADPPRADDPKAADAKVEVDARAPDSCRPPLPSSIGQCPCCTGICKALDGSWAGAGDFEGDTLKVIGGKTGTWVTTSDGQTGWVEQTGDRGYRLVYDATNGADEYALSKDGKELALNGAVLWRRAQGGLRAPQERATNPTRAGGEAADAKVEVDARALDSCRLHDGGSVEPSAVCTPRRGADGAAEVPDL